MTVSCICVTAGRVQHLEEAIESFRRQVCTWPKKLLVFNTCPAQQLQLGSGYDDVRIINMLERNSSLGEARNQAISLAEGDVMVTFDDDDVYLPHYLQSYIRHFETNREAQWVWLSKQIYMEGGKPKKITQGTFNTVAYTKDAWNSVGRFAALSVGEDRDFVGRLTAKHPGVRAEVEPSEIGFCYCWANSVWHISGEGDDKLNRVPAWERSRLNLESKLRRGVVPSGNVLLKPGWRHDYSALVRDFLLENTSGPPGAILKASGRRLFHAVERHSEPPDKRKEQAWASWDALYGQGVIACHYWNYERNANGIGDKRALPYLKDVLAFALQRADDGDVVFLTNDDNVLHPMLPDALVAQVLRYGPCCSQRCEFRGELPKLIEPPPKFVSLGRAHMGRDLFAATKAWWMEKWNQIPDYILGASMWDLGLASLFRLHHGIRSTRKNLERIMPPAEMPAGYVSHRFHVPTWNQPGVIKTAPSNLWNNQHFKDWAATHLPELRFHPGNII